MDLRAYYKKVRETEATLPSPHAVVVSLATSDGGTAGVTTEVSTQIAARMLVEGSARVATAEEGVEFRALNERRKLAADEAAAANRLQVVVVPANAPSTTATAPSGKKA